MRSLLAFGALLLGCAASLAAQPEVARGDVLVPALSEPARFRSRADSLLSERTLLAASRRSERRVVISLADRELWVLEGPDTLLSAPVSVGMESLLEYGGRRWVFETPRGVRTVRGKRAEPRWRPPDWAYAEVARDYGLRLKKLSAQRPVTLRDGRRLVVRDSLVGLLLPDGFAPLPVDEHIVFDSTLYIPPMATKNRHVTGVLGPYLLDMGDGYLLHGTPDQSAIRMAITHGCVRLRDEDIEWLYDHVPVGTRVYIY